MYSTSKLTVKYISVLRNKSSSKQLLFLAYIVQVNNVQKKNMKVCWLIFCVMCEYLDSHEDTYSHTSVFTCSDTAIIHSKTAPIYRSNWSTTLLSALNLAGSQCSWHHLSVCPSFASYPPPFQWKQAAWYALLSLFILGFLKTSNDRHHHSIWALHKSKTSVSTIRT